MSAERRSNRRKRPPPNFGDEDEGPAKRRKSSRAAKPIKRLAEEESEEEEESSDAPVIRRSSRPPRKKQKTNDDDDYDDDDDEEEDSDAYSAYSDDDSPKKKRRARKKALPSRVGRNRNYTQPGITRLQKAFRENTRKQKKWMRSNIKVLTPFIPSRKVKEIMKYEPIDEEEIDPLLEQPNTLGGEGDGEDDVILALRDYQLIGLNFMRSMYFKGVNPILGDEMGLGKTIQSVSYFAWLWEEFDIRGPHLVVCPLSVLNGWETEFKKWLPQARVCLFHGPRKDLEDMYSNRAWLDDYDIILTTFEVCKGHISALSRILWQSIFVDEAHRLKCVATQNFQEMLKLRSVHTVFLTGTPIQNNLEELRALLHFLFKESDLFGESEEIFTKAYEHISMESDQSLLTKSPHLLKTVMLRRIKKDVETSLPPKEEIILKLPMAPKQHKIYTDALAKYANMLNTGSDDSVDWREIRHLYTVLRKVANHPYLLEEYVDPVLSENMVENCGKLKVMDLLLARLKKEGHRVLIFSMFTTVLDLIEDYCRLRGHKYLRLDGSTHRTKRKIDIMRFNAPDSDYFLYLITNRAGGLGINLQSADTVIHYDTDWNPQADLQAQARSHRIGQKRLVKIYRLISEGTVEERILFRSQQKLYLDAIVNSGTRQLQKAEDAGEDAKEFDLNNNEVLTSIRFGAQKLFSGMRTTGDFSEKDLEELLERNAALKVLDDGKDASNDARNQLLKKLDQNVADFDFKIELQAGTTFEGQTFNKKARETESTILFGRRTRRSRLQKETAGGTTYNVLKCNSYNMFDEERVSKKTIDLYAQHVMDPKGKKRIYHETWCWNCNEVFQTGDEVIQCGLCPKAFHRICYENLGMHMESRGLSHGARCFHHECANPECARRPDFQIRCLGCLRSYCIKCMPKPAFKGGEMIFKDDCPVMAHFGFVGRSRNQAYVLCTKDCAEYYNGILLRRPLPPTRCRFQDMPAAFRKVVIMGLHVPLKDLKTRDNWDRPVGLKHALNKIRTDGEFFDYLLSYLYPNYNERECKDKRELFANWGGFVPNVQKKELATMDDSEQSNVVVDLSKLTLPPKVEAAETDPLSKSILDTMDWFNDLVGKMFSWRPESLKLLMDTLGAQFQSPTTGKLRKMKLSDRHPTVVFRAAMLLTRPSKQLQIISTDEFKNKKYK